MKNKIIILIVSILFVSCSDDIDCGCYIYEINKNTAAEHVDLSFNLENLSPATNSSAQLSNDDKIRLSRISSVDEPKRIKTVCRDQQSWEENGKYYSVICNPTIN